MTLLQISLLFTSGFFAGCAAAGLTRALWLYLRSRARRKTVARVFETAERLRGRILRHSPTGKVGKLVSVGANPHPRYGPFRATICAALACDKNQADRCEQSALTAVGEMISESFLVVPVSELAPALAEEIEAFNS